MNTPLSCHAQDMLEAAIIQRRRIDITCYQDATTHLYKKVLPVDITTTAGEEQLSFLTSDNQGGILKLAINTQDIISFKANDFKDPKIFYQSHNSPSC